MGNLVCRRRLHVSISIDLEPEAEPAPTPAAEQEGPSASEAEGEEDRWSVVGEDSSAVGSVTPSVGLAYRSQARVNFRPSRILLTPSQFEPPASIFANRNWRFYIVWSVPGHPEWAGIHCSYGARAWTQINTVAHRGSAY